MWRNLLARLPNHGCRVHLYLPENSDPAMNFPSTVQIRTYPRIRRFRPGRIFNGFTEGLRAAAMSRMWSQAHTGVFHSTHFTTNPGLKVPQVLTIHDLFHERLPECFPPHQRDQFCHRRKTCVERARLIVCDSRATLNDVAIVYPDATMPRTVVWLAVDSAFRKLPQNAFSDASIWKQPFLLYVGTRYPYKNFPGLLAAFAAWHRSSDFRLIVIGAPSTPDENAQIRAFGLSGAVEFHSANDSDLQFAYNQASAVVVPSLSEGFGLPVWEAMACGVPVVASRGGSLPEVGGDIPFYFDFGTPQKMADAIEQAVAAVEDCDRFTRGIAAATERTWDDVAAEYVDCYRTLLS